MQFCVPVGLSMFKDKQMMEPVWRLDHRALEWEEVVQIATWLPYHQYQVMGRHVLQPGHQAPREEVELLSGLRDKQSCCWNTTSKYFPQIGPFKKFKNRKQAFQQISRDVEAVLGITKTPQQCENRYKTVIRRRKAASDNNNQSGASPCPVPFDDDIRKIESIDDSIEPEVQRDASGAVFKNSPESPSLVSPNAKTTDKTESQSESADVKPRAGTARLQHMQLFFSEVRAIHEQKESLRAARHLEKENRRAERQADRQALREERRKMHDEKMGILRQAFGLQK